MRGSGSAQELPGKRDRASDIQILSCAAKKRKPAMYFSLYVIRNNPLVWIGLKMTECAAGNRKSNLRETDLME
jgi:hypothetical protein